MPYSQNKRRNKFRKFFESPVYDKLVFIVLIINIIILLINHDDQSAIEDGIQIISEYIFLIIYSIEVLCLFYTYGFSYFFNDGWRILCLIIVILSYINVTVKADFVKSNILVTIRLIRMFRLIKFARGIRALIQVVVTKYKQLLNIFIVSVQYN